MGTLHEDKFTFLIISRPILFTMRHVSDENCRENQNRHNILNNFLSENRTVYEIMWKSIVQLGRLKMTIWRMPIACWIPKATNVHSEYVILIVLHCNNGCTSVSKCYVTRTLPVFLEL
jgi:hypothetical protein